MKKNGDVEAVAKALHLHKNTIRYRMSRVRELAGDGKSLRFDEQLFVAFQTWELQKL